MLSVLNKTELKQAVSIYSNAFNVAESAAEGIVNSFADEIYVFSENETIKGMLLASKINIKDNTGLLLHGGYVAENYKKQGVFKSLIEYAVNNAQACFYVVNCNEKYIEFYEKLGFEKSFRMRELTREIKHNLWAKADFDTITAKKLCENRQKYIYGSFANLSLKQSAALLTLLYSKGVSTAETQNAYALYYRLPDKLYVTELYAKSDTDAWFLLEAIADRDGRNIATIVLSDDNTIFSGEGKRFNGGMIKSSGIDLQFLGEMPY